MPSKFILVCDQEAADIKPGTILFLPTREEIPKDAYIDPHLQGGALNHPVIILSCPSPPTHTSRVKIAICTSFGGKLIKYHLAAKGRVHATNTEAAQKTGYLRIVSKSNPHAKECLQLRNGKGMTRLSSYVGLRNVYEVEIKALAHYGHGKGDVDSYILTAGSLGKLLEGIQKWKAMREEASLKLQQQIKGLKKKEKAAAKRKKLEEQEKELAKRKEEKAARRKKHQELMEMHAKRREDNAARRTENQEMPTQKPKEKARPRKVLKTTLEEQARRKQEREKQLEKLEKQKEEAVVMMSATGRPLRRVAALTIRRLEDERIRRQQGHKKQHKGRQDRFIEAQIERQKEVARLRAEAELEDEKSKPMLKKNVNKKKTVPTKAKASRKVVKKAPPRRDEDKMNWLPPSALAPLLRAAHDLSEETQRGLAKREEQSGPMTRSRRKLLISQGLMQEEECTSLRGFHLGRTCISA